MRRPYPQRGTGECGAVPRLAAREERRGVDVDGWMEERPLCRRRRCRCALLLPPLGKPRVLSASAPRLWAHWCSSPCVSVSRRDIDGQNLVSKDLNQHIPQSAHNKHIEIDLRDRLP